MNLTACYKKLLLWLAFTSVVSAQEPTVTKFLSKATVTPADNEFGAAVAISDSYVVVSEPYSDEGAMGSGSVSVFSATSGALLRRLKGTAPATDDYFGQGLALSGTKLLVGCVGDDDYRGAAYVFDLSNGRMLRKLVASDGVPGDYFSSSVALVGNIAVIGASAHNPGSGAAAGAVYVFDINTGVELRRLTASDGVANARFGHSVSFDGQLAAVGQLLGTTAYVFDVASGTELWRLTPASGPAPGAGFGRGLALHGNRLAVGAPYENLDLGAVYVFDLQLGVQLRRITASDSSAGMRFGEMVALSSDLLAVSASGGVGAVYLYDSRSGTELRKIAPPSPAGGSDNLFGGSLAMHRNQVMTGHSAAGPGTNGAAYLIRPLVTTRPITQVAAKGDGASGALPAKFGTLSPPVVSGSGSTAFVSTLTGSTAGTGVMAKGLWKEAAGTHYLFGRKGRPIGESGTTTIDGFKTPIFNDDTDVLFEIAKKETAPAAIRPAINSYSAPAVEPIYMFLAGDVYSGLNGTTISRFDETVQDYDFTGATAAAVHCKTGTTRVTLANDTAVARVDGTGHAPLVGPGVLAFAESQPTPIGSDIRYGQMVPRVSIMKQSIMWASALVAGPTTPSGALHSQTSRALFQRLPGAAAGLIARAGDVASAGANYNTFLAAMESYDQQPTFKVTLTGPAVTTATNEGIYRYGLGKVWRKGDLLHASDYPGVKISRVLKFWSLRHGQVILLAALSGTRVTPANDLALILVNPYDRNYVLLREGDYTAGADGAKVATIQKVDVEPVGSQYVVLASLTGSTATNLALFTGRTTDLGPLPINPRLARAGMKLRKGTAYDTGLPGLPTGISTKITTMSITTTTDVAGAGGKGLGQAINDSGLVGLTIDFSNGIRQIRKGVP